MRKISDKEKQQLEEKYGSKVDNEQYLAGYFAKVHKIIYYLPEKQFYLHNKKKGIWKPVSDEKLIDIIGQTLHKYAVDFNTPEIESFRTASKLAALLKLLKGQVENKDAFAKRRGNFIHLANTMLEYNKKKGEWEEKDFSPEYYSRNQSPIRYSPNSKPKKFLKLLLEDAMTPDDIEHLQMYIGQCLLKVNLSQMFLLLIGMPGGGKSTLVNVVEGLVGRINCTELRLKHIAGRFELVRTNGKSLLTAKDVDSEFMTGSGAGMLKALTGNDTMTAEPKNSNVSFDVVGNFNVIITSNAQLRIKLDSDIDAWRRRLLVIKYEKTPTKKVIVDFDKQLLDKEGSGILNWALEGAKKLLKTGGKIKKSPEQEARINMLLQSSKPFDVFAKLFIHPTTDASITTGEVVSMFKVFCHKMDWPKMPDRKIQHLFHDWMQIHYEVTVETGIQRKGSKLRGYSHFQLRAK